MDLLMPPNAPVAFNGLMTFAWIAIFLLVGMLLRAIFPPFRKYLIPSCIIGGTVGLLFQASGLIEMTGVGIDLKVILLIVYHLFNLTWVYIGLRMPTKGSSTNTATTSKRVLWYFAIYGVAVYIAFGFGMLGTTLLSEAGLNTGPEVMGGLVSYGFVNGPGQALTIANIWEGATAFVGLPDFALAGGAMGFAVAIIVGIILLNIVAKKKNIDLITCPSQEEECGFYNECTDIEHAGSQTTSSTSIDVLAWHIAIGLSVYALSFIIALVVFLLSPPSVKVLVWSSFFAFGAVLAIGVRKIMMKCDKGHLLCNGITTRISNTLVDFMVCATFISIQVGYVSQYMLPYIVSVVIASLSIGMVSWFYCSKLKTEGPESFAFMFGNLTGTVSTGFVLLRLVDPHSKSDVPVNLGMANALHFSSNIIFPILLHMQPLYKMSAWSAIGAALALAVIHAIIARIFRQPTTKTAWEPDTVAN